MVRIVGVIYFTIMFSLAPVIPSAQLIINEVMSNEPGSQVTLEWIELYNNSDKNKILAFALLNIDGVELDFPGGSLGPNEYCVVCRRLVGVNSFESVWGNNNGVWDANDPGEDYLVIEMPGIQLDNGAGLVTLTYPNDPTSVFVWTEAGLDGVSWERDAATSDNISNSIDPRGGTPGAINSNTPYEYDLAVVDMYSFSYSGGTTVTRVTIINVGQFPVAETELSLYYDPELDGVVSPSDLITAISIPATIPDDNILINVQGRLTGLYAGIAAVLPDDDHNVNNGMSITAPGEDYPPVVISEFLANPDPDSALRSEWVEVKNISSETIDMSGWMIGNDDSYVPAGGSELLLESGAYMVLCGDSLAMVEYYGEFSSIIREPTSWATLRNAGDMIRLKDNYGISADSIAYDYLYDDNFTWALSDDPLYEGVWGRSVIAGGTPGAENDILNPPTTASISVSIEPNPFSISRGESAVIKYSVPPGGSMSVRVYDREGRVVRTLLENMPPHNGEIEWNGLSDAGRQLPAGIYIVFIEVPDAGSNKQTVVISP